MANAITNTGFDLAMDIVQTFPPKYWKKKNYEHVNFLEIDVNSNSYEFTDICEDIESAQDECSVTAYDDINSIIRIQNPYTYARFMLRKNQLNKLYSNVYQFRKFKFIDEEDIDSALKYNCDARRYTDDKDSGHEFYSSVPEIPEETALLILQVLSTDEDDEYEAIECDNDSEFYIEYVVYFE